ncbi:MAG: Maf family protein [Candidatus Marsarchaeota archaeon]|nr:Maf family protein [Candidatus Marsarchaeota archaeon]
MTILPLILASESPRRKQILQYFTIPFESIPHTFDEKSIPWQGSPHPYVNSLAGEKAKNVAATHPDRIVIAADTIVVINGELLTKPLSRSDAKRMLQQLSGTWHSVVTAIAVARDGQVSCRTDETRVLMQVLPESRIEKYLDLNIWSDKAGGYAIQEAGSLLVQRIDGCYYNVIGLPVGTLCSMLEEVGIDMWNYLR